MAGSYNNAVGHTSREWAFEQTIVLRCPTGNHEVGRARGDLAYVAVTGNAAFEEREATATPARTAAPTTAAAWSAWEALERDALTDSKHADRGEEREQAQRAATGSARLPRGAVTADVLRWRCFKCDRHAATTGQINARGNPRRHEGTIPAALVLELLDALRAHGPRRTDATLEPAQFASRIERVSAGKQLRAAQTRRDDDDSDEADPHRGG